MKICSKCGVEKPEGEFVPNRKVCRACEARRVASWYAKNSSYAKERMRKYYLDNCEQLNNKGKAWRKENDGILREYREERRFRQSLVMSRDAAKKKNHTPCMASEEEIEVAFTGLCHACGLPEEENGRRLHMDHDHETGEFRGWLCQKCNVTDVFSGKVTI